MNEKLYFTLEELIEAEKKINPHLKGEDLEESAKAGHVETDKGFIWYSYWETILNNKKKGS